MALVRPDKNKIIPRFLHYYFMSPAWKAVIEANIINGATVDRIPIKKFPGFQVSIPPIKKQASICNVLSAYDDLIENNRRRIQLLEQAARLLYREWFVNLRFPGHEHTKIVNGVPEGWISKTNAGVCDAFEDGDWVESKDQGGEDFRLLQISNIGDNVFIETDNYRYLTAETFRRLHCNEVVPGDILISRMPKPIGRAWYVTEKPWRMITAVDVTIARPNPEIVNPLYYLYHLNSPTNIARCELLATGATRLRVSRKNMGALPIIVPPKPIQSIFGEIAADIHWQRRNLIRQNEKLVKARDLLLPKLINGEVQV
jgi:type I restriction enzyme S subunit